MNENRVVAQLSNSAGEREQKYMFYCEGSNLHICHNYVTDGKIQFLSDCTPEHDYKRKSR
jgi:hypothetical protein